MVDCEELLSLAPYSLDARTKQEFLGPLFRNLSEHHYFNCLEYRRIVDALGIELSKVRNLTEVPFLPVGLFKEYDLLTVDRDKIVKRMTSSGTTGQHVSKIYLDSEAAAMQSKVLARIVTSFIGVSRLPMIVLDARSVASNREQFSARAAGIRGFSLFAREQFFALNDEMELDLVGMERFLEKHSDSPFLLFGFTFMVWKYFFKSLSASGIRLDMSRATLIHGGGWKALTKEMVSPERFKDSLQSVCRIAPAKIRDYYGMVEQTGTIHMECEQGFLHTSIFGDVIIRRHADFTPVLPGETGIVQVMSVLPRSYPGHSLLTEDEGLFVGEDDCACGRLGKYFRVIGRLRNAETRGCGDAFASRVN